MALSSALRIASSACLASFSVEYEIERKGSPRIGRVPPGGVAWREQAAREARFS
jgi:hypothetical protein